MLVHPHISALMLVHPHISALMLVHPHSSALMWGWTNIRVLKWEWKSVNFLLEMSQNSWNLHIICDIAIDCNTCKTLSEYLLGRGCHEATHQSLGIKDQLGIFTGFPDCGFPD